MRDIKVSIIVPSYNHADYITDTINSVLNQDYKNIELLIIDDGSTDNSDKVIRKCINVNKTGVDISYVKRENRGLISTLKELINMSSGDLICFLASDDILTSNSISSRLPDFESDQITASFGKIYPFDEKLSVINEDEIGCTHRGKSFVNFSRIIKGENKVNIPSALFRADYLIRNPFPDYVKIEDYWLYTRMYLDGVVAIENHNITCLYRYHDNNFSKRYEFIKDSKIEIVEREFNNTDMGLKNKLIKSANSLYFRQVSKFNKRMAISFLIKNKTAFDVSFFKGCASIFIPFWLVKKIMKGH